MFRVIHAALMSLFLGCGAAAQQVPGTCYSAMVTAPAVRSQTILLVDLTTARTQAMVDFKRTAERAAAFDGQRYLILTFAGLGRGEQLQVIADFTIEAPITDPTQKATLQIKPFRKSQTCVAAAKARWQAIVQNAVADALEAGSAADYQRSEIVYALRETLREFAKADLRTRLLIYSDGLQHGSGVSFYSHRLPRAIDAEMELGRQPAMRAKPVAAPGTVTVLWYGLLARTTESTSARSGVRNAGFYDAEALEQLKRYWSTLLLGWGAAHVQIGPTLLNPRLDDVAGGPARESGE